MKKLLFTGVIAAMLTLSGAAFAQNDKNTNDILPIPVETEESYSAEVSLPVNDIKENDVVYLNIALKEPKDIYGFEMNIEYDSSLLKYKGTEINSSAEKPILVEENSNGELFVVFSCVGNAKITSENMAVIEFSAISDGEGEVILKSLKTVFDDMTYKYFDNLNETATVVIEEDEPTEVSRPSHGGGGGGGGSFKGGSVTSSATITPPEPIIKEDPKEEPTLKSDYTDIDETFWAYDAIKSLSDKGIISGYTDGSFKPNDQITRAEFAKLITSMSGIKYEAGYKYDFVDVFDESWYFDAVYRAAYLGLMKGESGGTFRPDDTITREEAAVVIERSGIVFGKTFKPVCDNTVFKDENEISDFAAESVDVLCLAGIISGDDNGCFNPKNGITRAETATLLSRFDSLDGGEF